MGGELSLKVEHVYSDSDFVRPTNFSFRNAGIVSNDLSMTLEHDGCLHICGNNDWAFLALELLKPIKDEAMKIMGTVQDRLAEYPKIKAVMLGKNDKRIMDVYCGGKGKCDKLFGMPVIETDELNEVKFLVKDTNLQHN